MPSDEDRGSVGVTAMPHASRNLVDVGRIDPEMRYRIGFNAQVAIRAGEPFGATVCTIIRAMVTF